MYNVAGPQPMPIATVCKIIGKRNIPLPETLIHRVAGRFGMTKVSKGAVNHVKYPCVIDSALFDNATGFTHEFDEIQTLNSFRIG